MPQIAIIEENTAIEQLYEMHIYVPQILSFHFIAGIDKVFNGIFSLLRPGF